MIVGVWQVLVAYYRNVQYITSGISSLLASVSVMNMPFESFVDKQIFSKDLNK